MLSKSCIEPSRDGGKDSDEGSFVDLVEADVDDLEISESKYQEQLY